jgi:hypothetical protein
MTQREGRPGDHFTKFPEWLWGRFSPTTTLVYLPNRMCGP